MLCKAIGLTRCVLSTLPRRGKSLTSVSRIAMLELSNARLDCNDATHPVNGLVLAML